MANTLHILARRRYETQLKEAVEHGVPPLDYNVYVRLLETSFANGFKCGYCKVDLKLNDTYPYYDVPSIDHKIPLDLDGPNTEDNLCVCCHRCNAIKSTMTDETYKKFLSLMNTDPFLKVKMFDELWRGRLASKMSRVYPGA